MDYYRAFPFYSGYQGYSRWSSAPEVNEDRIAEDLDYLRQMYPSYAKKYQSIISRAVDKMDYDGSFIYDQYPDKLTMQRMVSGIMAVIKTNEEKDMEREKEKEGGIESEDGAYESRTQSERQPWAEKEPWIKELVTLVMFYEILGRRRKKRSYFFT